MHPLLSMKIIFMDHFIINPMVRATTVPYFVTGIHTKKEDSLPCISFSNPWSSWCTARVRQKKSRVIPKMHKLDKLAVIR